MVITISVKNGHGCHTDIHHYCEIIAYFSFVLHFDCNVTLLWKCLVKKKSQGYRLQYLPGGT